MGARNWLCRGQDRLLSIFVRFCRYNYHNSTCFERVVDYHFDFFEWGSAWNSHNKQNGARNLEK